MSRTSDRIDGVSFEAFKGRFSGTVELEEEEASAAAVGEVVVFVGVASIMDVQAKLDKDGVLSRIDVFKVTEARVLEDDLKQILVDRLGLYGNDTLPPPVKIVPGERTPTQRAKAELVQGAAEALQGAISDAGDAGLSVTVSYSPALGGTAQADASTGEVVHTEEEAEDALEDEFADWQARQAEQEVEEPADVDEEEIESLVDDGTLTIGHIGDMTAGVAAERSHGNGPRTVPMSETKGDVEQLRGQSLGRIGTKDPVLSSFLQSDDGWS